MSDKILSQEDVKNLINIWGGPPEIVKSHAALLEKVDELETCKSHLDSQKVTIAEKNLQISELTTERNVLSREVGRIKNKVTELEKQLAESQSEVSRLKELYEPEMVDTKDQAEKRVIDYMKKAARKQDSFQFFFIHNNIDKYYLFAGEKFPYAEPKELKIRTVKFGTQLEQIDYIKIPEGIIAKWDGHGSHSISVSTSDGYRIIESGAIVPKKERQK